MLGGKKLTAERLRRRLLTRHHLSAVPFCNTFLIYEEEPPTVDPWVYILNDAVLVASS